MKIAITKTNDPYVNLSTEEVMLKDTSLGDVILLYINDNTIVVGRNQNTNEEIEETFVKENNIKVIRRVSGGGSVYHDLCNLNFSFITKKNPNSYEKFLEPVIEFLRTLGLDAKFKGKNDLEISGFKVSGNAQYIYQDRMFHHGTLLFDSNLSVLSKAIKPNTLKLESKSIKSNRARVTNISELLTEKITMDEFVHKFIKFMENKFNTKALDLTNYKLDEIQKLAHVRRSHEWNFGKNPNFSFTNAKRFDGGTITLKLNIVDNKINDMKFFGDFLSRNDFEKVYEFFINKEYNLEVIKDTLNQIPDIESYFGKLDKEQIVTLFEEN